MIGAVCELADGHPAQTSAVGKEGLLPVTRLLDEEIALHRHVVLLPSAALSIGLAELRAAMAAASAPRAVFAAYLRYRLIELMQAAACVAAHALEARCGRWLLMVQDRARADIFPLPPDAFAQMLGVARPAMHLAVRTLQQAGLVRYARVRDAYGI